MTLAFHALILAAALCATASRATAATPPTIEAKGEDILLKGESVNVNLGDGGSFSIVDSDGEVQASLPADLTAMRRSTTDMVGKLTEGLAKIVTSDDTRQAATDTMTEGYLKGFAQEFKTANANLARTADAVEAMANTFKLAFVGKSKGSYTSNETATLYGRGFLAGGVGMYSVSVSQGGSPVAQDVVAVTATTISFATSLPAPNKATQTVQVELKEGGKQVPFTGSSTGTMDAGWTNAAPTITRVSEDPIVHFPSSNGVTFDVMVADADHTNQQLVVKVESLTDKLFTTSNTAASSIKDGVVQIDITKVEPNTPGKGTLKVTVTDALKASTSIMVDVIVHAGVAVDGWELVMKIKGAAGSDTCGARDEVGSCMFFNYESEAWENDQVYGTTTNGLGNMENVKYASFLSVPFKKIRVCSGDPNRLTGGADCFEHTFKNSWDSARALFTGCDEETKNHNVNGNACRASKGIKEGMEKVFKPSEHKDCPPQTPGFSQHQNNGVKTRWGYANNFNTQTCQPSDGQDSDGAIGVGLAPDLKATLCPCGAGMTSWFERGSVAYDGCKYCKSAWLWVQ